MKPKSQSEMTRGVQYLRFGSLVQGPTGPLFQPALESVKLELESRSSTRGATVRVKESQMRPIVSKLSVGGLWVHLGSRALRCLFVFFRMCVLLHLGTSSVCDRITPKLRSVMNIVKP